MDEGAGQLFQVDASIERGLSSERPVLPKYTKSEETSSVGTPNIIARLKYLNPCNHG